MDCLHPIRIINPTKHISLDYSDRYVNYVRCGKCSACQQTLSREWYFRAFHEFQNTLKHGDGCYVYFDCLTYAPKYVPKVSRFFDVPEELDFMCFDYNDIAKFLKRLRRKLQYRGFDVVNNLRYFICTEYGTEKTRTHRPHMHVLFYVLDPSLDSLTLSRTIAECWKFGRTDGLPYKTRKYVLENTITKGLTSSMRVCKYVSKYVMKSSTFQSVIDSRISKILYFIYSGFTIDGCYIDDLDAMNNDYDYQSWCRSETGKKFKRDIVRHLNQFHRQSVGFGLSALEDLDINEVMRTNLMTIPDNKQTVMRIGLPMYFKRKLFYELVEVDGVKSWQLTELGKRYQSQRKLDMVDRLTDFYTLAKRNYNLEIDNPLQLAKYSVYHRGRVKGEHPNESTLEERLQTPLIYNYVTSADKKHFHNSFLSLTFLGNKERYLYEYGINTISIDEFINSSVQFNPTNEEILSRLDSLKNLDNPTIQKAFDLRQRLNQTYKTIYT